MADEQNQADQEGVAAPDTEASTVTLGEHPDAVVLTSGDAVDVTSDAAPAGQADEALDAGESAPVTTTEPAHTAEVTHSDERAESAQEHDDDGAAPRTTSGYATAADELTAADEPIAGDKPADADGTSPAPSSDAGPSGEASLESSLGESIAAESIVSGSIAAESNDESIVSESMVAESITLESPSLEAVDTASPTSSAEEHAAEPATMASVEAQPEVAAADVLPALPADAATESAPEELKTSAELKAILEALIFASPEPLTRKAIGKLLASEPAEDVDNAIAELKRDYDRPGGLQLVEVASGYQIVTRPDLHDWVRRLFHERTTQKLSVQALETLAVIAYRQPVTALEVTEIRGVTAAGVLNTLLERHLIKIVGRKKVVGRPFLYATTKEFLIRFGLNEIGDLPRVEDMAEALGFEPPLLTEQSPAEDILPLDEPETKVDPEESLETPDEQS